MIGLPNTSRRAALAGGIAALAARPAAAVPNPDAELIAMCERLPRLIDAVNDATADVDQEAGVPEFDAYAAALDYIRDATPRTLAGWMAKARAAKREALDIFGEEHPESTAAAEWAWDLMNDMLAMLEGRA